MQLQLVAEHGTWRRSGMWEEGRDGLLLLTFKEFRSKVQKYEMQWKFLICFPWKVSWQVLFKLLKGHTAGFYGKFLPWLSYEQDLLFQDKQTFPSNFVTFDFFKSQKSAGLSITYHGKRSHKYWSCFSFNYSTYKCCKLYFLIPRSHFT